MLLDPFRNGVLLCELVALLENVNLVGTVFEPRTVAECRSNLERALCVVKQRCSAIPQQFFSVERILRGERSAIWGLMHRLMLAYPNALPKE